MTAGNGIDRARLAVLDCTAAPQVSYDAVASVAHDEVAVDV
jgi:hypothetical protein